MTGQLDQVPTPVVSFSVSPLEPSTHDIIRPFDFSFDPARRGIAAREWDFGDGTRSTGACPAHRYQEDGEYTIALQVTTADGRVASAAHVVCVSTHDVAITQVSAPKRARPGVSLPVIVSVENGRYAETVQVELLRSVGGPFERVGVLTKVAPARGTDQTTDYAFSYAFTENDAAAGAVTFRAIASILGARDARPADNTVTAPGTVVL